MRLQMTFALCLQLPNHLRFKRPVDIWANFVPQMIFLQSIFGYLVICILYKWSVDWVGEAREAPALLNMLINMFLKPGTIEGPTLFPGQGTLQVVLLGLAGICVPWMLCVKPYIEYKELQKIQGQGYVGLGHDNGPRHSADDAIQAEEGNGPSVGEEMEEDHVRASFPDLSSLALTCPCRNTTTSAR
jgi:V-type H+-transporting ATPase subunit a